jgi:hypothetical protein
LKPSFFNQGRADNLSNFRNHHFESQLSNIEVGAARIAPLCEHGTGLNQIQPD